MKEPYFVYDAESKQDKWNRGLDLFIESVHKPDHELMDVRDTVLEYLKTIRWQ